MELEQAERIASELIQLMLANGAAEYAGEKVSQLQHMYQAGELARQSAYAEETILAAFLHDIGHISEAINASNDMDGWGIVEHEKVGAHYLIQLGFSKRLAELVDSHVYAKRYLTWKDEAYYESLSEASKKTLEFQGGRMTEEEANFFEADPLFEHKIQLRLLDDQAKIEEWQVGDLEPYRQMMVRHLVSVNGLS